MFMGYVFRSDHNIKLTTVFFLCLLLMHQYIILHLKMYHLQCYVSTLFHTITITVVSPVSFSVNIPANSNSRQGLLKEKYSSCNLQSK